MRWNVTHRRVWCVRRGSIRMPAIRCSWTQWTREAGDAHRRQTFPIIESTFHITFHRRRLCSQLISHWFKVNEWKKRRRIETNMSARCANRKFVMWAGEKKCDEKRLREKAPFDPLTPRDVRSETFFFSVLLFVYYLRGVVFLLFPFFFACFLQFSIFLIFPSSCAIDLNWNVFFLHRLLLHRISSRETFSPTIILQFCNFNCFASGAREKKTSEKCELKTNEIWSLNSIGMRWNFHQHGKKHRLTFLKWNSAEDDDNIEEEMNCISWFVERLKSRLIFQVTVEWNKSLELEFAMSMVAPTRSP